MWSGIEIKRSSIAIAAILLLGFLLRFAFVLTLDDRVYWEDEADYLSLAQHIVGGQGYTNTDGYPTAFRPVGYPMLLAAVGYLGLDSLLSIRLLQVIISTVTIYLLFLYGSFVFNRNAGLAAALLAAIYPYFIFLPGTVLATTWFAFLLVSATFAFVLGCQSNNIKLMLAGGALFGVAALTQPSAGVLVLAVILWHAINTRPIRIGPMKILVPFLAALFLITAPWMYRNTRDLNYAGLATNGGRNLWLGNNVQATPESGSGVEMPKDLEKRISATVIEAEKDQIYIAEVNRFIRNYPEQFLCLSLGKAMCFWSFTPSTTTAGYIEQTGLIRWLSIMSFGPILYLAVLGFLVASKEQRKNALLWFLFAAFFTALHAIFIAKVRLRLPIDHFLIIGAGFALVHLLERIKSKRILG
jgi:4-amino-4-deoxy-L-arabinose transferase-like glycosyltransferase